MVKNGNYKEVIVLPLYQLCPFLTRTVTLHNKMNGYHTVPVGVNRIANNDVTYTNFLPCLQDKCMMYDKKTKKCLYAK